MSPGFKHLLLMTPAGLYCPVGDFYVDPWRSVKRAIITHAHSDHARSGSAKYLAVHPSKALLQLRLGLDIDLQTLQYGESLAIGEAVVTFFPAGHILGAAQVRIEYRGQSALITGDYKLQQDATCASWEPVACDLMVTESTFGLPVFHWPSTAQVMAEIIQWWQENQRAGRTSVVFAYSVGKAQRILMELCHSETATGPSSLPAAFGLPGPIWLHGAMLGPMRAYRDSGVKLPDFESVSVAPSGTDFSNALIVAPPSAQQSAWMNRFKDVSMASASGWMAIRGTRRRRNLDRGFVLSDHVDWKDLNCAVDLCNPEELWVTHGFSDVFARYQLEKGRKALPLKTEFQGEVDSEEVQV
jgi:putative mRNA 3-end processing factor